MTRLAQRYENNGGDMMNLGRLSPAILADRILLEEAIPELPPLPVVSSLGRRPPGPLVFPSVLGAESFPREPGATGMITEMELSARQPRSPKN